MLIIAIRHGQAENNLYTDDVTRYGSQFRDPYLTALGRKQAKNLYDKIHDIERRYSIKTNNIVHHENYHEIILTSPMKRALETLQLGLPNIHTKNVHVIQELQGSSTLPCDTGSPRSTLEEEFPCFDFSNLSEDWWYKSKIENNDDRVDKIKKILLYINDNTNNDIVILISHEGILDDLFGVSFKNCEIRTYIMSGETIEPVHLL
jgi:broad specificity phosphatase PhoE